MKAVLAIDSFKGCLSSEKALEAAAGAFSPSDTIIRIPLSDGGEGFSSVLTAILGAERVKSRTHNPLGDEIIAEYGFDHESKTAIIETAAASGITLIDPNKKNPLVSSSYGTGELIVDALKKGAKRILLGLGGSATNDGGTGLLQALGYKFLSGDNTEIEPYRTILRDIAEIDSSSANPLLDGCTFECFYDVSVPFFGEGGATHMFGPQKGVKKEQLDDVDKWMGKVCSLYSHFCTKEVLNSPGSGAAGGIGGATFSVLKASMNSGIDKLLDICNFDDAILDCDIVITGEGKADNQTLTGKAPYGVLKRVMKVFSGREEKPKTILIAGKIKDRQKLLSAGFDSVIQVTPDAMPIEWALDEKIASFNISSSLKDYLEKEF